MWTVKRILIFVLGLLGCLSSFATYTLFFGIIDGLAPLPERYWPGPIELDPDHGDTRPPENQDMKLVQAFGTGCKELQRPLRLWLPDKGIAFAAGDFILDKDGRVRLAPFSGAVFHKGNSPRDYPEISTIQCDVAILTLDRPATNFNDLYNRKVIAVEMSGKPGIVITNNRRTAEKNDDLDILISNGNLFYEERRNLIWTDGVVCLTDHHSKPPTVIRGTGLEMTLLKDSPANRPRAGKSAEPKSEYGNIHKIKLRADVQMHFWVDARAGFLGGAQSDKKNAEPAPMLVMPGADKNPQDKAQIHIRTGGPFLYDLTREFAWFESPAVRDIKNAKARDHIAPDQVHVERLQKTKGKETLDQLICDRLELQFRKKGSNPNAGPNNTGSDKEIETAHATKQGKNFVTVALESEKMEAYAAELVYRAGDNNAGPMTILKGETQRPLRAGKDGHKVVCDELHLVAANRFGDGQRAWAKGPGQIDLLDTKNIEKDTYPTHLIWRDTLTVVKTKEGTQVFDLMTVVGEASFIDDVQKQSLHGEKIMVWVKQLQESANQPDAVGGGRHELHRVIAEEMVRAISPEFIIRKANIFQMVFVAEQRRDDRLPDAPAPGAAPPKKGPDIGKAPAKEASPQPKQPPVANAPLAQKKPQRPIELEANEIIAVVSTLGTKKQLQDLTAKGNVYVFQAGEKQGEKGIDITGRLLTVKQSEAGSILVVYGEKDKLARVEVGDSIVWGPRVTVNQATNQADVDGHGAMDMPTNKNLDGTEASKKNTRIVILWNKNMTFDGQYAMFHGGVEAYEKGGYSKVQCQVMHAVLDKTISFKDGQKKDQNAKIDHLIFDKNVYVDDAKVDDNKKLAQRTILMGSELINYQDRPTRIKGPGELRNLAKGSGEMVLAPPAGGKPADAKRTEWKLTHVKFRDGMTYHNKINVKTATFYGYNSGVEVFHFPTIKINDVMDPDRPPKDGLYLRCGMLTVESKQMNNRTIQTMIAQQNVLFKTDKYFGRADIVKYDEHADNIILEGINGNRVQLYEWVNGEPKLTTVESTKVLYNRKTGKLETDGVKSITN